MLRAIFFDLDDTLCDTLGCRPERMRIALAHVCGARPGGDIERLLARALEPLSRPREVRGLQAVLTELGLAGTPLGDRALDLYSTCFAPLRLFAGVERTLAELRASYRLGIISNAGMYQHAKLAHLRLDRYVEQVTLSSEAGYEKPDPRIFAHAVDAARLASDEAIFVGDRLDVDIAGAQAAGLRAVWFNHWGGQLEVDGTAPDAIMARFDDLLSVIPALSFPETAAPARQRPRAAR